MRYILLIIISVCAMIGSGRMAYADCLLIDRIDKMNAIQARLLRNPDTALFTNDIRQLRHMISQVADRDALAAVDGNPFGGRGATTVRFLQNTRSLVQSVSLDDPYSTRAHFTARVRQNLEATRVLLTEIRCDAEEIAIATQQRAELEFAGESGDGDIIVVQQTLSRILDQATRPGTLVILLLLVIIARVGIPLFQRWRDLRRRQIEQRTL